MSPIINYRRELATTMLFEPEVRDVVHDILFQFEDVHASLAANPHRRSDLLARLYAKKAPAQNVAEYLVRPELTAADRAIVIKKEKRSTVLWQFFRSNVPTSEEQAVLCARPTPAAARLLLGFPWLENQHRARLARRVGGRPLLQEMAFGCVEDFTDSEVLELLADHVSWKPDMRRGEIRYILIELFTRRPEIIPAASRLDFGRNNSFVLGAMANSANLAPSDALDLWTACEDKCTVHYLARDVGVRLIENPRTPLSVVDYIAGSENGSVRSIVSQAVNRRGRRPHLEGPIESFDTLTSLEWMAGIYARKNFLVLSPSTALALLCHRLATPHLREQMSDALTKLHSLAQAFACANVALLKELRIEVRRNMPVPYAERTHTVRPEIDEIIQETASRFTTDRVKWETLIGLAPDFENDIASLLETASLV